ncbi:MAG: Spy/CpxP family protein refolding chaperone [Rariglobus sp.]
MKSTRKYILAVCALAIGFALPAVHAQDDSTPPPPKKDGPGGPRGDRGGQLKEALGLSDAQAAQIKKIHADEHEQLKALREKEGTREEKGAEMRKIREATKAKVEAVLTAEQKAKFEELQKNRKAGPGGPDRPKGEKGPKDGKGPKGPPPAEEPVM